MKEVGWYGRGKVAVVEVSEVARDMLCEVKDKLKISCGRDEIG